MDSLLGLKRHATSAAHSSREVFQAVTLARMVSTSPVPLAAPRPGMQMMVTSWPGHTSVSCGASWSVQLIETLNCRNCSSEMSASAPRQSRAKAAAWSIGASVIVMPRTAYCEKSIPSIASNV